MNDVASGILEVLGGAQKLSCSIGATRYSDLEVGLRFKFGQSSRKMHLGNITVIVLNEETGEYTMSFARRICDGGTYSLKYVRAYSGLNLVQLKETFEIHTGLFFRA